jgi:hypothetical protein
MPDNIRISIYSQTATPNVLGSLLNTEDVSIANVTTIFSDPANFGIAGLGVGVPGWLAAGNYYLHVSSDVGQLAPTTYFPLDMNFQLEVSLAGAVPKPSTWAMIILGFAGVGAMAYRRSAAAAGMP